MLQHTGQAITFSAFFTDEGEGATGLTVTVDVYRDGTGVVSDAAATEIGGGVYAYTLAAGSVNAAGNYVCVFKTSDTADQAHLPALVQAGPLDNLDAAVSTRSSHAAPDLSNLDAAVSTRSSHSAADVWSAETRTLTGAVTVGTNNDKTGYALTSGERSSIATAVWAAGTRTLTSFGSLVSSIWSAAGRTLTAFGFTVATGKDAIIDAIADRTERVDGLIEDDGSGADRFTAKALEQGPAAEIDPEDLDLSGLGATVWTHPERSLTYGPGSALAFGPAEETIELRAVLRQVAGKAGLRYEEQDNMLVESWIAFADDRLREFWEAFLWPDILVLEELETTEEGSLRYLDAPGVVRCYAQDPRGRKMQQEIFFTRHAGSRVWFDAREAGETVWTLYRPPSPRLLAEADDGSTEHAEGDYVYFDSPGNVYKRVATEGGAGSNPTDNPADWQAMEIPRLAQRWLVHAVYADWLRDQGEGEKAAAEERRAQQKLEDAMKFAVKTNALPGVAHRTR